MSDISYLQSGVIGLLQGASEPARLVNPDQLDRGSTEIGTTQVENLDVLSAAWEKRVAGR